MNMAVVLKVPAIFIFENNGYGEHTAASYSVGGGSIADRARSFGMPAEVVDGVDFFAVHDAMSRALEHCRPGTGPYALEIRCYRFLRSLRRRSASVPHAGRTQGRARARSAAGCSARR